MPGSSSGAGNRRHSHTPDAGGAVLNANRDRRHSASSSSDMSAALPDSTASNVRQFSNENVEYLPARLAKVTTSKPAANPLQFVKVGPCGLYRSAQEQLRKVEQVKQMKAAVRDDAEDWQSNLDSWKSSRRRRQEHIIERVVEVKKLELEEHERARRKSKTFSEILEERRGRKLSLPMYQEEEGLDLSTLGIGNSSNGASDVDANGPSSDADAPSSDADAPNERPKEASPAAAAPVDPATSAPANGFWTPSDAAASEPPQEYTFEGAIQSYVDFTETRVRHNGQPPPPAAAPVPTPDPVPAPVTTPVTAAAPAPAPAAAPARAPVPAPARTRAHVPTPAPKPALAKVDVGKRCELFEKAALERTQTPRLAERPTVSPERPVAEQSEEQPVNLSVERPTESCPSKPCLGAELVAQAQTDSLESADIGRPRSPVTDSAAATSISPTATVAAASTATAAAAPPAAADLLSEAFERVQGLQALSSPLASSLLAVDARGEDSGIHTAEASCSVSQADEVVESEEAECDAVEAFDGEGAEEGERDADENEVSEETATTVGSEAPLLVDSPSSISSVTTSPTHSHMQEKLPTIPPSTPQDTIMESQTTPTPVIEDTHPSSPLSLVSPVDVKAEGTVEGICAVEVCGDDAQLASLAFPLATLAFPLGPPSRAAPPKEKPPPPPTDLSDTEDLQPESPLRRLDSTKRIKKEIRRKRSDFLGLEGGVEEPSLSLAPPPDLATLLAEERRAQRALSERSQATDANDTPDTNDDPHDAAESRDSGVELERGAAEDAASPELHSRNLSEIFHNTSLTSEEEGSRHEQEILTSMEQEDHRRRGDSIGVQLAERLRVLEMEKAELERRRIEEEGIRREEERQLTAQKASLRLHENTDDSSELQELQKETSESGEALRREEARLHAKQEQMMELEMRTIQQPPPPQHRWSAGATPQSPGSRPSPMSPAKAPVRRQIPPPPPAKPQRVTSQEQRERDNSIRSSRVPSADCLANDLNRSSLVGHLASQVQQSQQAHQMTRQTLQALSAAPRSRLITNDTWMQARRKPETSTRPTLNTQHWLIQEAEHRRLTEQAQRCDSVPRRPPPPQSWAHHQPPPPPPPPRPEAKPLPDAIIQTLTQRVQGRAVGLNDKKKAPVGKMSPNREQINPVKQFPASNCPASNPGNPGNPSPSVNGDSSEKMLSVSGKKKCSHCGEELGRGAAMIIESLRLFYHIDCFKCCVCHVQLGDGLMGTDVRVRNSKLHCHNCYSSEDGVKFSCV